MPFTMNVEVVPVHRVQRNLEKNDYIVICGIEIYYAKKDCLSSLEFIPNVNQIFIWTYSIIFMNIFGSAAPLVEQLY